MKKTQRTFEKVYQCKHCLSVYDKDFGDEINYVAAGTPFENLKEDYECATCGASKTDFVAIEKQTLVFHEH